MAAASSSSYPARVSSCSPRSSHCAAAHEPASLTFRQVRAKLDVMSPIHICSGERCSFPANFIAARSLLGELQRGREASAGRHPNENIFAGAERGGCAPGDKRVKVFLPSPFSLPSSL